MMMIYFNYLRVISILCFVGDFFVFELRNNIFLFMSIIIYVFLKFWYIWNEFNKINRGDICFNEVMLICIWDVRSKVGILGIVYWLFYYLVWFL